MERCPSAESGAGRRRTCWPSPFPEEGIELRNAGIAAPILVLGGIEESAAEAVVQYNLTQVVFDESRIRALAQAGRKLSQNA